MFKEYLLTDVSEKDRPWDVRKSHCGDVSALYAGTDFNNYAERMQRCGKSLIFALTAAEQGEMVYRLQTAWFCRVRHCPVCCWRRSLMWKARFLKALSAIMNDYPQHRWIFLTLTVRNCELVELRQTLSNMNKAWKGLTKKKAFPATGWVKTVEVTKSKNGTTHPHFHVLVLVPPSYFGKNYLSQNRWTQLWQDALKVDYTPILDVRSVRGKSGIHDLTEAIKETFKYSVKNEDLDFSRDWLLELTKQLHKTRSIALGGVLKDYLSEEEDNDDLIHVDEDEGEVLPTDQRWWFGWREMAKHYIGSPIED